MYGGRSVKNGTTGTGINLAFYVAAKNYSS